MENIGLALRRALAEVRRARQAHLRAVEEARRTEQAHLDAVDEAERALEEYEAQIVQDQRALAEEREELMQDKAALEEQRGHSPVEGFNGDVGQFEGDGADGGEDGVAFQATEAAPRPSKGGWLIPKSAMKREASRSRSPHRGGAVVEEVMAVCRRLGLDENASRQIQAFDPTEAMRMLDQVTDSVRNPSAFIMKMCHRAQQPGVESTPVECERVEAAIRDLNLDDTATRAVREIPAERALAIIEQIDANVRNPSAFVMSMLHRGKGGGGGGGGGFGKGNSGGIPLDDHIRERIHHVNLDQNAQRMLLELPQEQAMDILDQIGDDVRNPSAFVTAEAKKLGAGAGGGKDRNAGVSLTKHVQSQIEGLASALQLDATCIAALGEVDQQDALKILEKLTADLSSIRNPSAFVLAELKKRKAGGPRSGGERRAPVAAVPCKFFAKGMCKNGAECRFSHG